MAGLNFDTVDIPARFILPNGRPNMPEIIRQSNRSFIGEIRQEGSNVWHYLRFQSGIRFQADRRVLIQAYEAAVRARGGSHELGVLAMLNLERGTFIPFTATALSGPVLERAAPEISAAAPSGQPRELRGIVLRPNDWDGWSPFNRTWNPFTNGVPDINAFVRASSIEASTLERMRQGSGIGVDEARSIPRFLFANESQIFLNLQTWGISFQPPATFMPNADAPTRQRLYEERLLDAYRAAPGTNHLSAIQAMIGFHLGNHPPPGAAPDPLSIMGPRDTDSVHGINVPRGFLAGIDPASSMTGLRMAAERILARVPDSARQGLDPGARILAGLPDRGIHFANYHPEQFAAVYNAALRRPGGTHVAAMSAVLEFQMGLDRAPAEESEEARRGHLRANAESRNFWFGPRDRQGSGLNFEAVAMSLRFSNGHDDLRELNRLAGIQFNRAGQVAYLHARLQPRDGETPAQTIERALRAADAVSGNILQHLLPPTAAVTATAEVHAPVILGTGIREIVVPIPQEVIRRVEPQVLGNPHAHPLHNRMTQAIHRHAASFRDEEAGRERRVNFGRAVLMAALGAEGAAQELARQARLRDPRLSENAALRLGRETVMRANRALGKDEGLRGAVRDFVIAAGGDQNLLPAHGRISGPLLGANGLSIIQNYQTALQTAGLYQGSIDTILGPNTLDAALTLGASRRFAPAVSDASDVAPADRAVRLASNIAQPQLTA